MKSRTVTRIAAELLDWATLGSHSSPVTDLDPIVEAASVPCAMLKSGLASVWGPQHPTWVPHSSTEVPPHHVLLHVTTLLPLARIRPSSACASHPAVRQPSRQVLQRQHPHRSGEGAS